MSDLFRVPAEWVNGVEAVVGDAIDPKGAVLIVWRIEGALAIVGVLPAGRQAGVVRRELPQFQLRAGTLHVARADAGAGAGADEASGKQTKAARDYDPRRPRWQGGGTALRGFGVKAGTLAMPEQFGRAVLGLHVKTGARVLRPSPTLVVLPRHAPAEVARLWKLCGSERERRLIEQAMMEADAATVVQLVQTRAVVRRRVGGRQVVELAKDIALVSTVEASATRTMQPDLHVRSVLLGAERENGTLAPVDAWELVNPKGALVGAELFRAALAKRLARHGYLVVQNRPGADA